MNKKIIAIYDAGGKNYVNYIRAGFLRHGFEAVDMDIGTALSMDTVL